MIVHFVGAWHLAIEDVSKLICPFSLQQFALGVFLLNQAVYHIGIHTGKGGLLQLTLQHGGQGSIQLAIHHQHIVAFVLGSFYICILSISVVGIEIYHLTIFICLIFLHLLSIFIQGVMLTVGILQEEILFSLVIIVILTKHTIVDEDFDVIPFLLKLFTVILEDGCQFVADLLGDVSTYLLHVGIALQITSAYIQRNVWAVYHTVQQSKKFGDDAFYSVGHKYLVAVQLDSVALNVQIVLNLGEV